MTSNLHVFVSLSSIEEKAKEEYHYWSIIILRYLEKDADQLLTLKHLLPCLTQHYITFEYL